MKYTRFRITLFVLTTIAASAVPVRIARAGPVYTAGHGDAGVAYEAGELDFHLHFGADAVSEDETDITFSEFAPDEAYIRVPDSRHTIVPAGFEFTGANSGDDLWSLPQTGLVGVPLFGFATEELEPSDWSGAITFSLTDVVCAPENSYFTLWQDTFFGVNVRFDTLDDLGPDDVFGLPAGGHDDTQWGFTEPGVYRLEFTADGVHVTDGPVTGWGIYTFLVGDATTAGDLLIADIDCNGGVDFQDFLILQANFGLTSDALHGDGDLDNDGDVDFQDFLILQAEYGATGDAPGSGVPVAAAAVPEPSSRALALCSVLALGLLWLCRGMR